MIVMGADLATTSGLAILDGEKLLHVEAFRPNGKEDAEIFDNFRVHFRGLLVEFHVEHVGIEEPLRSDLTRKEKDGTAVPISNMKTFLRLYGLRGHAIQICRNLNIDFTEINQATWRKHFLRNGRGKKDDALAQCKLMRWPVTSKDAAEACGIAWSVSGLLRQPVAARPGELFAEVA